MVQRRGKGKEFRMFKAQAMEAETRSKGMDYAARESSNAVKGRRTCVLNCHNRKVVCNMKRTGNKQKRGWKTLNDYPNARNPSSQGRV